jgi:hypothetical protein
MGDLGLEADDAVGEPALVDYLDMMTIIFERVRDAAVEGKSLAQIKALKPTLEYDPLYSVPGPVKIWYAVDEPMKTQSRSDGDMDPIGWSSVTSEGGGNCDGTTLAMP